MKYCVFFIIAAFCFFAFIVNGLASNITGPCIAYACPTGYVCNNSSGNWCVPDCKDIANNCVANENLCDNSAYRELMKQKCPFTCDSCPPIKSCSDIPGANCASLAYLCKNQGYYDLMTKQCSKTCGRC